MAIAANFLGKEKGTCRQVGPKVAPKAEGGVPWDGGTQKMMKKQQPKGPQTAIGPTWANRGNWGNLIKFDQFFDFSRELSWRPLDRLKILS